MKVILALSMAVTMLFSFNETCPEQPLSSKAVNKKGEAEQKPPFTKLLEDAHKKEVFMSKDAVAYDIEIMFGGKLRMDARITQSTDGGKIKIDYKNGKQVIYNGSEVFAISEKKLSGKERFDIFTWSYFFAMPYKLNDEGTNWAPEAKNKWGETLFDTSKLTFNDGVGDTPKDWYEVYKNPKTNLLEGTAYIVSFGKSLKKAESDPHAIKFADFVNVDDVPFATSWSFHNWNIEEGYKDVIGSAKLSNIKFETITEASFAKTEKAVMVSMPNN